MMSSNQSVIYLFFHFIAYIFVLDCNLVILWSAKPVIKQWQYLLTSRNKVKFDAKGIFKKQD